MTEPELRKKWSIADECDITIDHATEHVESANRALYHDDLEQMVHDLNQAASILLAVIELRASIEVDIYKIKC